jgi:hypothetical protein
VNIALEVTKVSRKFFRELRDLLGAIQIVMIKQKEHALVFTGPVAVVCNASLVSIRSISLFFKELISP